MATGSDQFKYSTDGTKEIRAASCSVCSEDGQCTSARHYCVDCELYFCVNCVKGHTKIPSLKSHQVNYVDSSNSTSGDVKTQEREDVHVESLRCLIHNGKLIDTYCKDHGEVCCGTCSLVKHRLCSTESIAEASQDFQSNPERNKCKDTLTQVLIRMKEAKEKRTDNIDRIGKQKLELIDAVDKYEELIIAKVKELANISRKEIRTKYEQDKTVLDMEVVALDAAMTTTAEYVNKIEATDNEQVLFATVMNSKIVTRDGENLLQAIMAEWKDREIKLNIDKTLGDKVGGMKSLGVLEGECTVKEYEASFQNNIKIKRGKREPAISLYDMCLMDDGELLLTCDQTRYIRRYSSDLQYKDEIQLYYYPVAVCKIGKHEVAVRNTNKKVYFVSVGQSMQLTSSFTLTSTGYGMTYDTETGEILACEDNKISVYSKVGNQLRTYDKSTNGEPMFSQCRQIALNENKQDIYVTDYDNGVVVLDKGGHLKMKVILSDIKYLWPLCLLPGKTYLTGSFTSGKIVQIDEGGKQVGMLIETQDKRQYTHCLVYDHNHSRLFVGGYPGVISVYKMPAKRN